MHKSYLPAGKWLDVFGGKEYGGGKTVSREYGLREMPLFVRSGALIPLAYEAHNTKIQKWDKLVLDYYSDKTASDEGYLYEDDAETTAYKLGQFRKTAYQSYYCKECNAYVVNIEKAQGSFEGDKCFNTREITIKRHVLNGEKAVRVTVNGKEVEIVRAAKNAEAFPLNVGADASDGECENITFNADVNQNYEIKFYL